MLNEYQEAKLAQLIKEPEFFRDVIDALPNLVFVKDRSHAYRFVNTAFADFYGIKAEDIIGKTDFELEKNASRVSGYHDVDRKIFETGKHGFVPEEYFIDMEAEEKWLSTRKLLVFDDNGEAVYLLGISDDITYRKRIEIELTKAQERLSELNQAKDDLISVISHDLKNMFHTLVGGSEILHEEIESLDKNEVATIAGSMHGVAMNADRMLSNMLEWAKLQMSGLVARKQRILIDEVISEVLDLYEPQRSAKSLEFKTAVTTGLTVLGDRDMIASALRNVVLNSIKYSHEGGLIHVRAEKNGDTVDVSVADQGVGMDRKRLAGLFHFEKGTSTQGTQNEQGHGFGLVLTRALVEKNNGKVEAKSEVGKGTTFYITLPAGA